MRDVYVIPVPNAMKRVCSVWNNHRCRGWEID